MTSGVKGQVVLVKPHQRSANTSQTPGMIRQAGIAPDTANNHGLWMGHVTTPGGLQSGVHHHGDAESGIYILKGSLKFYYGDNLGEIVIAEPGDFIYVPPSVIHAEENLSAKEPVEFIVARNTTEMLVINVTDPRGPQFNVPRGC